MVWHEAKGQALYLGSVQDVSETLLEGPVVIVISEYFFSLYTASDHTIEKARCFKPWLSWHRLSLQRFSI